MFPSNIFAILDLRSMFFLLSGVIESFHLLEPALALVLAFVGAKTLLIDVYEIPTRASLGVIATRIAGGVVGWLLFPKRKEEAPPRRSSAAPFFAIASSVPAPQRAARAIADQRGGRERSRTCAPRSRNTASQ